MALALVLDSLEGIEETTAGLYKEDDQGKFRLDVQDVDFADEVKSKLSEVLSEKKALKAKYDAQAKLIADVEREKADSEKRTLKEKGEYKQLYETLNEQYEAEKKANDEFKKSIQKKDIETEAMQVAIKVAADPGRAELLSEKLAAMSRYTETGITYEIAGMEVEQKKAVSHLSEKFPFLVDGNKSSGGGATGSKPNSGGAAKSISREDFEAMNAADRMKFTRSGGTLTD